jgi:hypothetical protein
MLGLVSSHDFSVQNYLRNKFKMMKYGEEILVLNESHLNFALCYLLMVDCKLSYANLIADEK